MNPSNLPLYNQLRSSIQNCLICRGVGRLLQEDGETIQCQCLKEALYTYRLAISNIPPKFKPLDLPDYLYKDTSTWKQIKHYVSSIDKVVKSGHGLYVYGGPQSGRTLLACSVLKEAVKRGYSVYFITLGSLISILHLPEQDNTRVDVLKRLFSSDVDFVCLDSITEVLDNLVNMKTTVLSGQLSHGIVGFLEQVLSTRALATKPMLMTGSVSIEEISKRFQTLGTLMTSQLLETKCNTHHAKAQQKKRYQDMSWDQLEDL